jgi:peptidoglycan-N-acetylglucosamine deacetylase
VLPRHLRAILDGGHEVGHHGYLHEPMRGIDAATEARYLDRGLDALEQVVGVRPVGYRAPWWETNWHTPGLLAQRGFLYDSSLLDGDKPYRFAVAPGATQTLIEIPVDWALDDWEQYAFYPGVTGSGVIESPAKVLEMWTLEAQAHHLEGRLLRTHQSPVHFRAPLQSRCAGTTYRKRQGLGRHVGDHAGRDRRTRTIHLHPNLPAH